MNIYLLTQGENRGYDTHDSMVVAAPDELTARLIHPDPDGWRGPWSTWARKPENVVVELIGEAVPGTTMGIILASFNAG